jgi:DNA-directed RNA polymerase subunit M/transcription elongation factor TFIIS
MIKMSDPRKEMLEALLALPGCKKVTMRNLEKLVYEQAYNETMQTELPNWKSKNMYIYFEILSKVIRNWEKLAPMGLKSTELATITEEQIDPSWMEPTRKEIAFRSTIKLEENISTDYVCSACGKNQTKVRLVQDRASDEPQSVYVYCVNCPHRWRINT